jgi:hypothetical protein
MIWCSIMHGVTNDAGRLENQAAGGGTVENIAGVVVYAAAMVILGATTLLVVRHVVRAQLLDPDAPVAVI